MAALDFAVSVGSDTLNYGVFVAGHEIVTTEVILDAATAGYTPALGDVVCYDTADTNKHQKYDADTATHVILGVLKTITTSDDGTPVVVLGIAEKATVYFEDLGTTGVATAAEYLALKNALRAKGINAVQATDAS